MTHEELRAWCHVEMRALAGSPMYARGAAFLKLLDAALGPPWLADAAEALGEVRHDDGAPLALNWTQVIAAIHEMREERDEYKLRAEQSAYHHDWDAAWLLAAAATVAEPGSGELILGEMGEKARVVFVGEPFPYVAIWSENDGWVPYNRKDQSHNGVTLACRVRMNVWCADRHAMYWYEMSAATFRVLVKHRERAPIEDRVFQIERMDSDDACPIYRLDETGVYLAPPNAVRWDLGSCGHLAEMATAEAVRLAVAERDKYHRQAQDTEKKLAAIATLVSIYNNQDELDGQVSARRVLTAIGETIGQPCSICRSRHGSEVQHAAE